MNQKLAVCLGHCRNARHALKENAITLLVALTLIGAAYLFWFYKIDGQLSNRPIDFNTNPVSIELEKEEYRPGEMVRGRVSFCKTRPAVAAIQWSLSNGQLINFPAKFSSSLPVGCYPSFAGGTAAFDIERVPEEPNLVGHVVQFEGSLTVTISGGRTVDYSLRTQRFTVVE